MPLSKDVNIKKVSEEAEGYVGADIQSVCREAAMLALREDLKIKEVSKKHFDAALKKVRPSSSKETMENYETIEEEYIKKAKAALPTKAPDYLG